MKTQSWQSEPCTYCGGTITDKQVDLHRKIRGKYYILIEDIPAGVCTSCGARFYTRDTLERIAEIIRSPELSPRNIQVAVFSLVASVSTPGMVLEESLEPIGHQSAISNQQEVGTKMTKTTKIMEN
jgi:YgiT-type zinc finger domain-containing protein